MKHLFFAVTLTVFLFGVSLTCAELVRCRTQEVADRLTLAQAAAERADAEAARRETKEAAALWERHTPLLDALVQHAEIDGVSGALAELEHYAGLEHPEEFLSRCARLLHDLRHIRDLELPLPQNVL
ncbi:MAG: DUF4363 family protein [Oscillospiraceae bacterium]|nr:DUF4363 family protein [Oscillospiraceae bacterium]